jgi:hypothetical protein
LLFITVLFLWYTEHKDIHCPSFHSSQQDCENGGGMSFSHSKPETHDSPQTLLNKISKASEAETLSIKWRRSFLLSVAITLGGWIFVWSNLSIKPDILPDWKLFYLSVMICYVILLGHFMYYSYHVYATAEQWIKQSLNVLKSKMGIIQ